MTNTKTIYRNAAALAAIQLDRPFSARDMARLHLCIKQARLALAPTDSRLYDKLAEAVTIAGNMSDDTHDRLAPVANLEEALQSALDDTGKRIAKAFAPAMPKIDNPTP